MSTATISKVFLGSIPHTVTEENLRTEVSQYGDVVQMFYMQDQVQQSRGWAFVTYGCREEAIRAINSIDAKLQFPGSSRPIEARFANQKHPNINAAVFQGQVAQKHPTPWQQYFTPEGHPYYYHAITGQTQWERPAELDSPAPQLPHPHRVGGAGTSSFGPPGANLFVFHVPSDWNDVDLIQHFQHFGVILSARIQRADSNGRNRGFGFVSFDNTQSAINAIRGMNGFNVGGKYLKVQLKKGEEHYLPPGLQQLGRGDVVTEPHSYHMGGVAMTQHPVGYPSY